MRSIFFAPHSDDEVLFGCYTLLKYQPTVVICFPSSGDYGDTKERYYESVAACLLLGVTDVRMWDGTAIDKKMAGLDLELKPDIVWAPSRATTHDDHKSVALAAGNVFGDRLRKYETYVEVSGEPRKVSHSQRVPVDDTRWYSLKHFALTKYETQIRHPRASQFFAWDLHEYAEQP